MAGNISNNSKDNINKNNNIDDEMMYENNQRNYFNNFLKRKRNKSQGEHLQYLKIKLYRDGKFLTDFTPRLINSRYNDEIIFPSDFEIDREEINKTIYNKKILDKDDLDDLSEDINLVATLDRNKINKLRFSNSKQNENIQETIKKNIQYLIHAIFQPNTIVNINGLDVQILNAKIIDKNDDIHNTIIAKIEDRKILSDYKKYNQDYYIKYFDGDSSIHSKVQNMEKDKNYLNNSANYIFRKDEKAGEKKLTEEKEGLLSIGGYNFFIAIDVKISTDKVLKKSKFKGIISPFASCKTKRAALSEILDYNINLFETEYLKIDKPSDPLPPKPSGALPPKPPSALPPKPPSALPPKPPSLGKNVKGGRRTKKKTKRIRKIRKKLSKKKKFLNKIKNNIYK